MSTDYEQRLANLEARRNGTETGDVSEPSEVDQVNGTDDEAAVKEAELKGLVQDQPEEVDPDEIPFTAEAYEDQDTADVLEEHAQWAVILRNLAAKIEAKGVCRADIEAVASINNNLEVSVESFSEPYLFTEKRTRHNQALSLEAVNGSVSSIVLSWIRKLLDMLKKVARFLVDNIKKGINTVKSLAYVNSLKEVEAAQASLEGGTSQVSLSKPDLDRIRQDVIRKANINATNRQIAAFDFRRWSEVDRELSTATTTLSDLAKDVQLYITERKKGGSVVGRAALVDKYGTVLDKIDGFVDDNASRSSQRFSTLELDYAYDSLSAEVKKGEIVPDIGLSEVVDKYISILGFDADTLADDGNNELLTIVSTAGNIANRLAREVATLAIARNIALRTLLHYQLEVLRERYSAYRKVPDADSKVIEDVKKRYEEVAKRIR